MTRSDPRCTKKRHGRDRATEEGTEEEPRDRRQRVARRRCHALAPLDRPVGQQTAQRSDSGHGYRRVHGRGRCLPGESPIQTGPWPGLCPPRLRTVDSASPSSTCLSLFCLCPYLPMSKPLSIFVHAFYAYRNHMPARLCLPPSVDNRTTPLTDHIMIPIPCLRVNGLPHRPQHSKRGE